MEAEIHGIDSKTEITDEEQINQRLERLTKILPVFKENKDAADEYGKSAAKFNAEIKSIMRDLALNNFEAGTLVAKFSISQRVSFLEDAVINVLQTMQATGLISTALLKKIIKKKEYVDFDALEAAIYTGKIKAEELVSCQVINEVETLRVTTKKMKITKQGEEE